MPSNVFFAWYGAECTSPARPDLQFRSYIATDYLYIYTGMLFEVMKLFLEDRPLHRGWWGGPPLWRGNVIIEARVDVLPKRSMMQAFTRYSTH